ncbi:uncharacterized protein LOC128207580 isoform X1 [Mya arenaria]|uniref:uncharacterized protein LOC128207580 isoform X1 n=1 Tax=Mya arenaria TaxID=6604 RepID=UPI0022E8C68F|nr:uncharacterized protein LOC128207580 isoform X1 [Mya arenaria]
MTPKRNLALQLMCFCFLFFVGRTQSDQCLHFGKKFYDSTNCNCSEVNITSIANGSYTNHNWNNVTYVCDDGYTIDGNETLFCEKKNSQLQWHVDPPRCKSEATTPTGAATTPTGSVAATTTTGAAAATTTTTTTTTPPPTPPPGSTNTEQLSTTSGAWNELSSGASKSSSTISDNPISTNISDKSNISTTTSLKSTALSSLVSTDTKTIATQTEQPQFSKGSFPTLGSVGIAVGVLIIVVAFIVGLIIVRRKQKHRGGNLFGKKQSDYLCSNIHSNAAYAPHATSVDNESVTSKDSGLGKHDESGEEEPMDGEYNTIMVHYPDVNQQIENTYNHMDESPSADSTYSHIPNSKDALFDNTYSHVANDKPLKALEPNDTDTTYNHLGDSSCSKQKNKKEETYNDTYNHTQINPGCPKTDPDDQDDNYSHINQQESNAGKKQADVQDPTKATTVYDKMNEFTKIAAGRTKQYDESVNSSMTNAEGVNNAESHTYFDLESNAYQRPKQAPYDYAVVAMPEKDRTEFKVVDSPTDPPHEYFVIEPEFKVVDPPTDTPHEYFVIEPEFKVVDPPTDTPHEYFVIEPTTEL